MIFFELELCVGDIVYIWCDLNKIKFRDRYLVVINVVLIIYGVIYVDLLVNNFVKVFIV